jgi:geranylgeranyl diphosphate synthase, type I
MDVKNFKTEFDFIFLEALNKFVENSRVRSDNVHITASIDHIVLLASNGKRIRPYNVAVSYQAYSGESWKKISHLLIGIELIHLMALIHDDIMDNADTRHGVDTAHEFTKKDIQSLSSDVFINHVSLSQAILIGDIVFGWAYNSISKNSPSEDVWGMVHELVDEVIVGQMMDVLTPLEKDITVESVEKKMLLKTARYTFSRPLIIGALCAGKNIKDILYLQEFGDALGLMFQAQDDLLDVTTSESLLKKSTLGDIKNGVHTLISVYVSLNANDEQQIVWDRWFGKNTDLNPVEVNEFLKHIGAIDYAEEYIVKQKNIAEKMLAVSDLNEDKKDNFKNIINMLSARKY